MTNHTADASLRKTAGVAGFMFLLSLMVPLLNWVLVLSKFIVAENAVDTVRNILANEFLYRIGIINDLIASAVTAALALSLYIILKSVNKGLALLALSLKLTEAILLAVIALGDFIALLILKGQAFLTGPGPEQIQALVGLFVNTRMSVSAISMTFLGLNLTVFSYLLFKSKYVPRMLAGFGMLSYALIFMYALMTILSPDYAEGTIIRTISWTPSVFFELMIGSWLLIKGINVQRKDSRAFESL